MPNYTKSNGDASAEKTQSIVNKLFVSKHESLGPAIRKFKKLSHQRCHRRDDLTRYASIGPAELGVGNYLAHLDEYGIRCQSAKDRWRELGEYFLEGYLARSERGCERSIEIWRKLALARHISIGSRISDRSHATHDLLDTMLA